MKKTIAISAFFLILASNLSYVSAEVLKNSALDPDISSYDDSMTITAKMAQVPKWEPAQLPPHVIPSVVSLDMPRNQKVRMTPEMYTVQQKAHKLHAPVAMKVYKVHPSAVKTVKTVNPPATKTITTE